VVERVSSQFLIINPGSTSTKVAVFRGSVQVINETIRHPDDELKKAATFDKQLYYRKRCIEKVLQDYKIDDMSDSDIIMARGGIIRPVPSGVYIVCSGLIEDLLNPRFYHASNLAGLIAYAFSKETGCMAYICDPPVVDEMDPIARLSGNKYIERTSIFHALNHKAVARRASLDLGIEYCKARLIVAHLGGGISVGAHCNGRVTDVNNALIGEGPFSPERSGGLPVMEIIKLKEKTEGLDINKIIIGQGGLKSYLGTSNAQAIETRIEAGDSHASLVYEAMGYQVSKEIASLASVLYGKIDAIVITGGLAHSKWLISKITERVSSLAKILIYPGEDEMLALAEAAMRVNSGEKPYHYCSIVNRVCPEQDDKFIEAL
jgi:butyrate kinase